MFDGKIPVWFVASHLNDDKIIAGDKKALGTKKRKPCRQPGR